MVSQKPSRTRRLKSAESDGRQKNARADSPRCLATACRACLANMSAELAKMAGDAQLCTLNYFLDMARAEAESQIYKFNSPSN